MAERHATHDFSPPRSYDEARRQGRHAVNDLSPEYLSEIADYLLVNPPFAVSDLLGQDNYGRMLDATGAQLEVASTAAETTIYSKSIGGGTLQANGAIHLRLNGDYLNNSGSDRTFTIRVKYGATTMWAATTGAITTNAARFVLNIDLTLSASNSQTAQHVSGEVFRSDRTAPTTGLGPLSTNGQILPFSGTASENSTLNKDLVVTFQHSFSASTISYRRQYAALRKIAH